MNDHKMFYIFISHHKKIIPHYAKISRIMANLGYDSYNIFYGGKNNSIGDDHIVHIDCDDTYEGLPDKIYKIYCYIYNNSFFDKFTHFCKVDATTPIQSLLPIINDVNYYGYVLTQNNKTACRNWHFYKTSKNSHWAFKLYRGKFIPYCVGGCYVVTRTAIECITKHPNDPYKDIYEDLYIAQQLKKCNIYPYNYNVLSHLINNKW